MLSFVIPCIYYYYYYYYLVEACYLMINFVAYICFLYMMQPYRVDMMQPYHVEEHDSAFRLIHHMAFHSLIESYAVGCLYLINSREDRKYHLLMRALFYSLLV
jgi:hypothetical protein